MCNDTADTRVDDITERTWAEQALRESEAQLEADLADAKLLQSISAQLIYEDNVEALYEKILDAAVGIMRSEYASMQMFYPERGSGGELRLLAFRGFNPQAARFWEWVRADSGSTCGAALRTGERVIAPDVEKCAFMAGTEDLAMCLQTGIHAVQTTPLVSRNGQMLGMISTHWREPHQPSERDLRLLDILARQAADFIERKRAEEALRESEERFRALVTASSDVVYRMSPDWSEMRHLQGRAFIADTHEPSRTWLDKYIHPDDQPHVMEAINEAIRTKGVFELEHRVIRADGTLGWTFSRAIPLLDADGEIVEWIGMASDVTERKQAEEALARVTAESERQKRLYETIFASTPDLVYVFDLNYRFKFANEALLQMWGRTLEESVGKSLLEIGYEPWHAEMHEREIDQVVATKQPIRGEVPFHHAVLGRRIYDYILVPVLNAEGEVEAIAGTTRDVTDRKQAEEALQRSEDRFRTMMEQSPLSMQIFDAEGRTITVNPAWERLWNASREAVSGYNILEDEQLEASGLIPYIRRAFAGEVVRLPETYYDPAEIGKNGRPRWIDGYIYSLRSRAGEAFEVALVHHDVTERKEAEEALRESEERLSAIFHQTSVGIAQTDLTGRYVLVNERYAEIVGRTTDDLLGLRMQDLTHPEDLPRNLDLFKSLAAGGPGFVIETRYVRPDGSAVWVNNNVSGIRGPDGEVRYAVAVTLDITEQKQAEEAKVRLAAIVESSGDAIISKDLNGIITTWNAGAERIFGYTAQEAVGQPVTMLMPPDRVHEEPGILARIRNGERIDHFETVRRRKDGTLLDISLTVSPIMDASGVVVGASKIARDITEQKHMEKALRASNVELSRFNRVAVGRELRMIELKQEVNALCERLGQPPRYALDFQQDEGTCTRNNATVEPSR